MTFIEWSKAEEEANTKYYLGVDFARMGGDENAFVIATLSKDRIKIVKTMTTKRKLTTDTINEIYELESIYNFRKIFIDSGGLGGPLEDILKLKLGRKVIGLNNASRRFQEQGEDKKKGILKQDLYSNALMLMEVHKLEMIADLDLMKSMKSITYEYSETLGVGRKVKIYGNYSHLTEALVRACWCIKEKGLDIYIF